jgi:hypothetical protein
MQREFLANQHRIVEELDRRHALRPPLTTDDATDILWTLNHPETYLLLTAEPLCVRIG